MAEFPKDFFKKYVADKCGVTRQHAHSVVQRHKNGTLIVRTPKQAKIVAAYHRLKKQTSKSAAPCSTQQA